MKFCIRNEEILVILGNTTKNIDREEKVKEEETKDEKSKKLLLVSEICFYEVMGCSLFYR